MNVKVFVKSTFRKKVTSLDSQISDERLEEILNSFDLDAVQRFIENEINEKLKGVFDISDQVAIRFQAEQKHQAKLKALTEQWVVYYLRESRKKKTLLEEDFRMITASMKQEAQFCDSYPCQKK